MQSMSTIHTSHTNIKEYSFSSEHFSFLCFLSLSVCVCVPVASFCFVSSEQNQKKIVRPRTLINPKKRKKNSKETTIDSQSILHFVCACRCRWKANNGEISFSPFFQPQHITIAIESETCQDIILKRPKWMHKRNLSGKQSQNAEQRRRYDLIIVLSWLQSMWCVYKSLRYVLWSMPASIRIINYSGIISEFFILSTSSLHFFSLFKFNAAICISKTCICVSKRNLHSTEPNRTKAAWIHTHKKTSTKNIMIEMNNDFSSVYWLMRAQSIIGVSCLTWTSEGKRRFNVFTMIDRKKVRRS